MQQLSYFHGYYVASKKFHMNEGWETLEQSDAMQTSEGWWEFNTTCTSEGKLVVEVFDPAGNCTKYEAPCKHHFAFLRAANVITTS